VFYPTISTFNYPANLGDQSVRRRSKYEAINSFDLTDFPVLTMDDLRDLTMGVYQLKQAPQYTREHIEPEYELFLVKDDMESHAIYPDAQITSMRPKNTVTHVQYHPVTLLELNSTHKV
jgi:hypothetical protein